MQGSGLRGLGSKVQDLGCRLRKISAIARKNTKETAEGGGAWSQNAKAEKRHLRILPRMLPLLALLPTVEIS